jgi:hypothetical protein
MKYIKLYEAFSSDILNKMIKYLKSENISNSSLSKFKSDLLKVFSNLDIPISDIPDQNVEYGSKIKIWKISPKGDSNISGLKFWFNRDGSYVGYSGVGNKLISLSEGNEIPDELLERVRNGYFSNIPKTGNLTSVEKTVDNYNQLNRGDKVIAFLYDMPFSEDRDLVHNDEATDWTGPMTFGTIWKRERDGKIFIIHDNEEADGSTDDDSREWNQYGSYSWGIGNPTTCFGDHYYLSLYTPSDKPLSYGKEGVEVDKSNPDNFNLKVSGDYLSSSGSMKDIINDADFGIYIELVDLKTKSIKDIKDKRTELKSGIIGGPHGLSNEELKEINIKRYTDLAFKRSGISIEGVDFSKLNDFFSNLLSDYFILNIILQDRTYYDFLSLISSIRNLVIYIKENRDENYIKSGFKNIESYLNSYKSLKSKFNTEIDSKIKLVSELDSRFGDLIKQIIEVGSVFKNKIKSSEFMSLYSLKILNRNLDNIKRTIETDISYNDLNYIRTFAGVNRDELHTFNFDGVNYEDSMEFFKALKTMI